MPLPTLSSVSWTGQPALWKGLACHQTPDDLWNFAEVVWLVQPSMILEVGTGEGGTSTFLLDMSSVVVRSVDLCDAVPQSVPRTLVVLDADVYSRQAVLKDLETYSPKAQWLVVCHTVRPDWGSAPALAEWRPHHPEWVPLSVRHQTQHTWLERR